MQKFKYGGKVSLGKPLGRLMARGCEGFLRECDAELIVPVPLHPKRLRWRGFNQSVLLARQVSRAYDTPRWIRLSPLTSPGNATTNPTNGRGENGAKICAALSR